MTKLTVLYNALSEQVRLDILTVLVQSSSGWLTVGEIAEASLIRSSVASHHLKILSDSGLVSGVKIGVYMTFAVTEGSVTELLQRTADLFCNVERERTEDENRENA